jgi:HK97 gp10 family phage protein
MSTKFQITGLKETEALFDEFAEEFGDKTGRSKVLIPAVKDSMKPVLSMAKGLVHKHTGALDRSLTIVARKPTNKDKRSKYISASDSVIAIVTSKPLSKKMRMKTKGMSKKGKQAFYENHNSLYDMRAIALEFGTKNMPAHPFMRISLESQASNVATQLGEIIKQKIEQYRSKTA